MAVVDGSCLLLVRHAMPVIDPAVPAERWQLGPDGRSAARALRRLVPGPAHYVASPEPKALQTVREIAGHADIATDPGFAEVHRPYVWTGGAAYRSTARSYVAGMLPAGWEPHEQVARRFDHAIAAHAAIATTEVRILVVGTHGLAPTIWLASRYRLEPDPARFWASLRFPDVVEVDLVRGTVRHRAVGPVPTRQGTQASQG